jgi:hypothetical protein
MTWARSSIKESAADLSTARNSAQLCRANQHSDASSPALLGFRPKFNVKTSKSDFSMDRTCQISETRAIVILEEPSQCRVGAAFTVDGGYLS